LSSFCAPRVSPIWTKPVGAAGHGKTAIIPTFECFGDGQALAVIERGSADVDPLTFRFLPRDRVLEEEALDAANLDRPSVAAC